MLEIPKILHLIWIQGENNLPPDEKLNVRNLKNLNNDFKVEFWNESRILQLLEKYIVLKTFYTTTLPLLKESDIDINASKSDIARWVIMYHYGGCYMDIDVECVDKIENIINTIPKYTNHIVATAKMLKMSSGQFFISTQNNPFWLTVFEKILLSKSRKTLGYSFDYAIRDNIDSVIHEFPEEIVSMYHCGCASKCMIPIRVGSSKSTGRNYYGFWCKHKATVCILLFMILLISIIIFIIAYHPYRKLKECSIPKDGKVVCNVRD